MKNTRECISGHMTALTTGSIAGDVIKTFTRASTPLTQTEFAQPAVLITTATTATQWILNAMKLTIGGLVKLMLPKMPAPMTTSWNMVHTKRVLMKILKEVHWTALQTHSTTVAKAMSATAAVDTSAKQAITHG